MEPFWQEVNTTPERFNARIAGHAKVELQVAQDIRDGKYTSLPRLATQFRRLHDQVERAAQLAPAQPAH
jgi:hypothetical protein